MQTPRLKTALLTSIAAIYCAVAALGAAPVDLRFCVIYSSDWTTDDFPYGIYAIDPTSPDPEPTPVWLNATLEANGGAARVGNRYFITTHSGFAGVGRVTHTILDLADGKILSMIDGTADGVAECLAYDETDGVMYGCFLNAASGYDFGTIDIDTGRRNTIRASIPSRFLALCFHPDGTLYAFDSDGTLLRVDRSDGATTVIGATGAPSVYSTAAAVDPASGCIYYFQAQPQSTRLLRVDPADGSAEPVLEMPHGEQCVGAYIEAPAADNAAPAVPAELTVAFDGPKLRGTLSFTLPSTLFDGSQATGSMRWAVTVDGTPAASGEAAPGERAECSVAVTASGMHEFAAVCGNDAGEGPESRIFHWVGYDTPESVKGLEIVRSAGKATLTWAPSVTGSHGAWFDLSEVTYDIISYPDGSMEYSGLHDTTATIDLPEGALMKISYAVTPRLHDACGEATLTDELVAGHTDTPWKEDFETEDSFGWLTVEDRNADGRTWTLHRGDSGSRAMMEYSPTEDADDYLFTPPLLLGKGEWRVAFDVAASEYYTERMEVGLFSAPDAGSRLGEVMPATDITGEESVRKSADFTIDADGIYCIGFHGVSPAGAYRLYLDNVEVGEAGETPPSPGRPTAPTGLTAIEGSTLGEAILEWSAPATDADGNPVDASTLRYNIYDAAGTTLLSGVAGTSATVRLCDPDGMAVKAFVVKTCNEAGESSEGAACGLTAFGAAYAMPFAESAAGAAFDNCWGTDASDHCSWETAPSVAGYGASDADGGLMLFTTDVAGGRASVMSAKISVEGDTPRLSFDLLGMPGNANTLNVYAVAAGEATLLGALSCEGDGSWRGMAFDMSPFDGRVVSLMLEAVGGGSAWIAVDNIRLEERETAPRLSLEGWEGNGWVNAGLPVRLRPVVVNLGDAASGEFNVKITATDDEGMERVVTECVARPLEPGEKTALQMDDATGYGDIDRTYRIELDGTLQPQTKEVTVRCPYFPTVYDFEAVTDDSDTRLSWDGVDSGMKYVADAIAGVELYNPFSTGRTDSELDDDFMGGWLTHDGDGFPTFRLTDSGGAPLCYPNATGPKAFMVLSPALAGIDIDAMPELRPRAGEQCFASFASNGGESDNWLISPPLTTEARDMTFNVKAPYTQYGPETVEVWWSAGPVSTSSMTLLETFTADGDWEEHAVPLPDGCRRVAFRHSPGAYLLMLDDIRLQSDGLLDGLELLGYHILCDGAETGTTAAGDCRYTAAGIAGVSHQWRIVPEYNYGFGPSSYERRADYDGVEETTTDGRVTSGRGWMEISGSSRVSVVTPEGVTVWCGVPGAGRRLPLAKGLYIVVADDGYMKVLVR